MAVSLVRFLGIIGGLWNVDRHKMGRLMKKISLFLLITFLTGELFLRIFYPQSQYSVTYADWGWRHIPNTQITFYGEKSGFRWRLKPPVRVCYGSDGLRAPEIDCVRKTGTLLALGDSFLEDMGSSYENLHTTYLENMGISVINAGHYGFCNAQEYMYYLAEGKKYRTEIVLVFYAQDTANPNYAELKDEKLVLKWKKFTIPQKIYKRVVSFIRLYSHFGSFIVNNLHRVPSIDNFMRKEQLNEKIEVTNLQHHHDNIIDFAPIDKVLFREFNQVVKADGATLILMNCMGDFSKEQREFLDGEGIPNFGITGLPGPDKVREEDKRMGRYDPLKESHRFGYRNNYLVADKIYQFLIIYRFLIKKGFICS